MSNDQGYLSWDVPLVPREHDGAFFLAGRWYRFWPEEGHGFTTSPGDGAVVLTMEDGSHVVQIPYRTPENPLIIDAKVFSTGFDADSRDDFRHLERQRSLGMPVVFFPGAPEMESFQGPGSFRLLRPQAADVVPGITAGNYPVEVRLDEVVVSSSGVTGQAVSAGSGITAVTYYPAYMVIIEAVQWVLSGVNDFAGTFTLQEIVGG